MKKITESILGCTSYQALYESFTNLFPELKPSIKQWDKDGYSPKRRGILVTLKNGIRVRFAANKDTEENCYIYSAYLDVSAKTKEKLGITDSGEADEDRGDAV